tara:strand:+ start:5814 stop:6365 length:552 start_codon:yes stop_codon:yes gene_type:complete
MIDPSHFDFEVLVRDFRQAAVSNNAMSVVESIMINAIKYLKRTNKKVQKFISNDVMLYEDESVSIWHCCFTPGLTTPPHDHQIPAIIGIYRGVERNEFYELYAPNKIQKTSEAIISAGETLQIGPHTIHSVGCLANQPCYGIHVYLGKLTGVRRSLFDLAMGERIPYTEEAYSRLMTPDVLSN